MSSPAVIMLLALLAAAAPARASGWWVFFSDKGPVGEREPRIEAARRALSERALRRRARARGAPVVDEHDLPPHPPYLEALRACGARLRAVSRWLNAAGVEAAGGQLECIRALPFVVRLAPLRRTVIDEHAPAVPVRPRRLDPEFDYGESLAQLELIDIPYLHACGLSGQGVLVGLIDTGFSLEHRALSHLRVQAQYDFINDDEQTADEPADPPGQDEHGTKVLSLLVGLAAGEFAGVAPEVTVALAKVVNIESADSADSDRWVAALEWLEGLGADIVSSSIGFCASCPPERLDGASEPTTLAAARAVANGVIVVNSAGNRGPEPHTMNAPADAAGVLAVGSVDLERRVAVDSSRGPTHDGRIKPDVMAPGAGVMVVDPADPAGYLRRSGTSYAAPLVAGLAALLLEAYPGTSPAQLWDLLRATASRADQPSNEFGWGLVSGRQAVGLHCSCRDEDGDGAWAADCGGDDCDDGDALVFPGAPELCDGIDNDCDGRGDEENPECLVRGCGCGGSGAGTPALLGPWLLVMGRYVRERRRRRNRPAGRLPG